MFCNRGKQKIHRALQPRWIESPCAFYHLLDSDSNGSCNQEAGEMTRDCRSSLLVKAHGEEQAERWLEQGCNTAGLDEKDLRTLKDADPRKLDLAELIWKRMSRFVPRPTQTPARRNRQKKNGRRTSRKTLS